MSSRPPIWRRLAYLDAHHRLMASLAVAAGACVTLPGHLHWTARALVTWDTYTLSVLTLAWLTIIHADPGEVARTASLQDSGRTTIFVFVVIAACASLAAVGALLLTAKGLGKALLTEHVILSVSTVLLSWVLVHTVFILRYAHIYYGRDEHSEPRGGLNFPDEPRPDYLDFAYFSFVIGMTCQVSDVGISSRRLRRLALIHGIITFGFNTAILALSINVISGLF